MNPYNGNLISSESGEFVKRLREGYEELPKELHKAAVTELKGQLEAQVDLKKKGPLQDWAKKKRKEKLAAKSRRQNRH